MRASGFGLRASASALALVLGASVASAEPFEWAGGNAWLHYELSGVHAVDDTTHVQELVLAGARLHGMLGKRDGHLAYHIGIDLAAGGTVRGGAFAYDVAFFPVGVALRLGETSFLALGGGVGASGAIGQIAGGATFPLELDAEIGGSWRLIARARVSAVERASRPREEEAMLALRAGTHYTDWGFPTGNGYFVGVEGREMYDVRYVGLVIGYSIDMATPTRHSRDRDYAVTAASR